MSEQREDERDEWWDDGQGDPGPCPVCHGSGYVHELTLPFKYATIAGYADCPVCDGSGEAP